MRFLFFLVSFLFFPCYFSQVEENNQTNQNNTNIEILPDSIKGEEKYYLKEVEIIEVNSPLIDKQRKRKDQKSIPHREKNKKGLDLYKSSSFKSQSFTDANDKIMYNKIQSRSQSSQRNPTPKQQMLMENANQVLQKEDPNSFEYNLNKYVIGNYNTKNYSNLKQAASLNKNSPELQRQMAAHHLISNNQKESKYYLNNLHENGEINSASIHYCKDLLESVNKNGTLITHGMVDSYGAHYNQINNHFRKDVQIINIDFLQSDFYRKELIAKGYKIPNSKNIDVAFFKKLCEMNMEKKLALSFTIPKDYFISIQNHLFINGLIFEYHDYKPSKNIVQNNLILWNSKMNKKVIYSMDKQTKNLASNYLPMLLTIKKFYKNTGNHKEELKLNKAIESISNKCGKNKQINKLKSAY